MENKTKESVIKNLKNLRQHIHQGDYVKTTSVVPKIVEILDDAIGLVKATGGPAKYTEEEIRSKADEYVNRYHGGMNALVKGQLRNAFIDGFNAAQEDSGTRHGNGSNPEDEP